MTFTSAVLAALLAAVSSPADLDRARVLVDQGRTAEARTILTSALDEPALRAQSLVLLTRLANREGDWENGTDWGKQALKALPSSSAAHYEYAVALRIKMSSAGKLKAMMSLGSYKDELAEAIRLDPANTDPRLEEIGFLLNAPGIAGGDVAKAKQRIAELKAIDWLKGARMEAAALQVEGDLPGAVGILREILAKAPADHGSRLSLALVLQQQGKFTDAEAELVALCEVTEGEWALAALYQRARSRILGKYEGEQAVELMLVYIDKVPANTTTLPGRSPAYWRLGNAYEMVGKRDEARAAYQQALSIDPDNDEAKSSLKALAKR